MTRMKVCVVDPSLFTLAYDQHLCAGLASEGVDVTLCGRTLRADESAQHRGYRFEPRCYRWTERGARRGPRGLGAWVKAAEHVGGAPGLRRWLERTFDVIHFQWSPMPAIDVLMWRRLARRRRVVFTVHDTTPFLGRPTSPLQKLGWRSLLRVAHGLIVHTRESRRVLSELGVPPAKIEVIPHGPLAPAVGQVAPAGVEAAPPTILLFGEIKPYKGVDVLLRAAALLPPELAAGWRILIAGRPRCPVDDLVTLAASSRVPVEWRLGFVPESEVAPLFRSASIVAFPYRQIDASGALMMALPFGSAVVATRVGVFQELLEEGETALLVDRDDAHALACALERLMRDDGLRQRLRRNVLERVERIWSWPAIARAHLGVYRSRGDDLSAGCATTAGTSRNRETALADTR